VLAGLAVAASLCGDTALYTVLPIVYERLSLEPWQVGIVLSTNRWVRLATNGLAETLVRHHRVRPLMVAALGTGALLAVLYGLAPPFAVLLAARGMWGLCWSVLRQVGVMKAATHGRETTAGLLVGTYNGLVRVGFLAGTLLSGLLFDAAGYRTMFFLMGGLMLLGVPATLGAFRRGERIPTVRPGGATAPPFSVPVQGVRGFVLGAVGSGILMSTLGYVLRSSAGEGIHVFGFAVGIATINGLVLSSRHVFGIAGSPVVGMLIDRFSVRAMQTAAFIAGTAALAIAAVDGSVAVPAIAAVVFFLCEVLLRVGLTVEASSTSRGYARVATAMDLGSAFGPIAAWFLLGVQLGERVGFVLAAGLFCAAGLVTFAHWLFVRKR
jgi:predicted MFS family arabinose efflux permease